MYYSQYCPDLKNTQEHTEILCTWVCSQQPWTTGLYIHGQLCPRYLSLYQGGECMSSLMLGAACQCPYSQKGVAKRKFLPSTWHQTTLVSKEKRCSFGLWSSFTSLLCSLNVFLLFLLLVFAKHLFCVTWFYIVAWGGILVLPPWTHDYRISRVNYMPIQMYLISQLSTIGKYQSVSHSSISRFVRKAWQIYILVNFQLTDCEREVAPVARELTRRRIWIQMREKSKRRLSPIKSWASCHKIRFKTPPFPMPIPVHLFMRKRSPRLLFYKHYKICNTECFTPFQIWKQLCEVWVIQGVTDPKRVVQNPSPGWDVWQQGLDSFGFPPQQYGRRDWREDLTLWGGRTPETCHLHQWVSSGSVSGRS
jgi:hypothetical protein